jgi:AhpD family alkylhydroperoxidase
MNNLPVNGGQGAACRRHRMSRLDYARIAPTPHQAMFALSEFVRRCGLEARLLELVMIRVLQMNGCAYCIDWHATRARNLGVTERRLYSLPGWRESPFYSDRECAALELAESMTDIAQGHVPDAVYTLAQSRFTNEELVNLALAIVTINAWNRLTITFRSASDATSPGDEARQTR